MSTPSTYRPLYIPLLSIVLSGPSANVRNYQFLRSTNMIRVHAGVFPNSDPEEPQAVSIPSNSYQDVELEVAGLSLNETPVYGLPSDPSLGIQMNFSFGNPWQENHTFAPFMPSVLSAWSPSYFDEAISVGQPGGFSDLPLVQTSSDLLSLPAACDASLFSAAPLLPAAWEKTNSADEQWGSPPTQVIEQPDAVSLWAPPFLAPPPTPPPSPQPGHQPERTEATRTQQQKQHAQLVKKLTGRGITKPANTTEKRHARPRRTVPELEPKLCRELRQSIKREHPEALHKRLDDGYQMLAINYYLMKEKCLGAVGNAPAREYLYGQGYLMKEETKQRLEAKSREESTSQ
ncbi:hypothetical protein QBC35DRAFT_483796 [Podospora australis]|uniref:Uncharacterized protein n=1 Tax=Podospora australis TaxID=1536484 RepID=A0AAN7AMR8_9PEZI|nr:hypothetical protein QBC35DRAFT_483796 [Podospora australis]